MAVSDKFQRASLIPSFVYSPPSLSSRGLIDVESPFLMSSASFSHSSVSSSARNEGIVKKDFAIPAPNEPTGKIKMFSPAYYAACTAGGIFSCGLTHMAVTPLDLVKCNMQVNNFIHDDALFYFYFFILLFGLSVRLYFALESM